MIYFYVALIAIWVFVMFFSYNEHNGTDGEWWYREGILYIEIIAICAVGLATCFMID